jgi:hypothetical protein
MAFQRAADLVADKGLDSAVSFAQSLSQWAYITVGASVALLLRDFAHRPKSHFVRGSFLLFLPGWALLVRTIYQGMRVHEAYIAYLFNPHRNLDDAILNVNSDAASQVSSLRWGLAFFFVWLVIYLFWWIIRQDEPKTNENLNRP